MSEETKENIEEVLNAAAQTLYKFADTYSIDVPELEKLKAKYPQA